MIELYLWIGVLCGCVHRYQYGFGAIIDVQRFVSLLATAVFWPGWLATLIEMNYSNIQKMKIINLVILAFILSSCAIVSKEANTRVDKKDVPLSSLVDSGREGEWHSCGRNCYRFIPDDEIWGD